VILPGRLVIPIRISSLARCERPIYFVGRVEDDLVLRSIRADPRMLPPYPRGLAIGVLAESRLLIGELPLDVFLKGLRSRDSMGSFRRGSYVQAIVTSRASFFADVAFDLVLRGIKLTGEERFAR